MQVSFLDIKSLGLLLIWYIFSKSSLAFNYTTNILGFISVKVVLEYLGSIAAFCTIIYNIVKTGELLHKHFISIKWKRKRKTDKSTIPNPMAESEVNDDQFD